MPDQQLSLHLPAHQNRQLFLDHYLNEILPTQARWLALMPQAASVLAEIAGIFERFTPSENERQTEDNLVVPVLRALGHTVEVQAPLNSRRHQGTGLRLLSRRGGAQGPGAHRNGGRRGRFRRRHRGDSGHYDYRRLSGNSHKYRQANRIAEPG